MADPDSAPHLHHSVGVTRTILVFVLPPVLFAGLVHWTSLTPVKQGAPPPPPSSSLTCRLAVHHLTNIGPLVYICLPMSHPTAVAANEDERHAIILMFCEMMAFAAVAQRHQRRAYQHGAS
ncbi:hypothetical protein BGZ63DRAFT_395768 [Mariannaea sp. PMI_226]|nr:hypothetical protein BGZ63DRAFT_395768 [Mariannaea sp. PMI_226]